MLFIASLLDSYGAVDVTADGSVISITDNSNYQEVTGMAQSGGATTITLESTSSDADDYYNGTQIEILDGTGVGQVRTISDYNGTTKEATVSLAWSVNPSSDSEYVICEAGHLQSQFTAYKKIKIINPDDTTYEFDVLGYGDETIDPVSSETVLPITTDYSYTTGDGRYQITLISVPSWNSGSTYYVSNYPVVYYGGKLYQALLNTTNHTPSSSPTYWEEISDTDLSTKYSVSVSIVATCDTKQCFAELVNTAWQLIESGNVDMCKVQEWKDANILMLGLESLQGLVNASDWNGVSSVINRMKQICNCCD